MKKFGLTSASFTGQITYIYDDKNFLCHFDNQAELTEEQVCWILAKIPLTIKEMHENFAGISKFKVEEIPFKVTFEMMWDRYNDKSRSSRTKSLAKWDKMNETNQTKAYNYYPKYNKNRGSAEKKYLTTYLADELWNN